jgi:hypothetical protein
MVHTFRISLFAIVIASTLQACVKNDVEVNELTLGANPQFGIPIAYSRISAERAIEHFDNNGLVVTDEGGALSIVYRSSETVIAVGDFLTVPNQEFTESITPSIPDMGEMSVQGSVTIQGSEIFELIMPEGDRLDSARFDSGNWRFGLQSSGNYAISGSVQLRSADNQQVLLETIIGKQQPPVNTDEETNFENLLLTFVSTPGIENGIRIAYELTLTSAGGGAAEPIQMSFALSNLVLQSAGGYIAPRDILIADKGITVSMFDNAPDYDISIEEPVLNFYVNNGFGMGVNLDIHQIRGFNKAGSQLTVTSDNIFFDAFVAPALQPGFPALTTIRLDNEAMRPTVSEFFEFKPNYISSDLTLSLNHLDEGSVFISRDADLRVSFEADVPIFGSLANFNLVDTADISLGDVVESADDLGYITALDIRLIVDNGLPLDAGVQIVFCDSLYNRIDSLFSSVQYVFNSAPVNQIDSSHPDYGRATGKTRTVVDIPIPRERVDNLTDVKRMIITVLGNTATNGNSPVRFFSGDEIETQLSAKITLSYDNL